MRSMCLIYFSFSHVQDVNTTSVSLAAQMKTHSSIKLTNGKLIHIQQFEFNFRINTLDQQQPNIRWSRSSVIALGIQQLLHIINGHRNLWPAPRHPPDANWTTRTSIACVNLFHYCVTRLLNAHPCTLVIRFSTLWAFIRLRCEPRDAKCRFGHRTAARLSAHDEPCTRKIANIFDDLTRRWRRTVRVSVWCVWCDEPPCGYKIRINRSVNMVACDETPL